jgi:hypothetical protein
METLVMKTGSLRDIAQREGGLTRSGKVSVQWARAKLKKRGTTQAVKRKLIFFLNSNTRKGAGKTTPKKRRKNPVPLSTLAKVEKGMHLYRRFRGQDPKYVDEHIIPIPDVLMEIGKCDGVLYTTVRDGKTEQYVHEFTGRSKPILASSWDGKQIYLLGGHYSFTDEGIIDQ